MIMYLKREKFLLRIRLYTLSKENPKALVEKQKKTKNNPKTIRLIQGLVKVCRCKKNK